MPSARAVSRVSRKESKSSSLHHVIDHSTRKKGPRSNIKIKSEPTELRRSQRAPKPVIKLEKKAEKKKIVTGRNSGEDDLKIDTEDEDWVKPNFKDKKWFAREARRCQKCKKTFNRPADASMCITSHRSLRCYFCFRTYSSTDILFRHFQRRHKQGKRESSLMCPFCNEDVAYKTVSCHVISFHLALAE